MESLKLREKHLKKHMEKWRQIRFNFEAILKFGLCDWNVKIVYGCGIHNSNNFGLWNIDLIRNTYDIIIGFWKWSTWLKRFESNQNCSCYTNDLWHGVRIEKIWVWWA